MHENRNKYWIMYTIVIFILSFIFGWSCHCLIREMEEPIIPENIQANGVRFELEDSKLRCDFVTSFYDAELNYNIYVIDRSMHEIQSYLPELKNGIGNVILSVQNGETYQIVLVISNNEKEYPIILAERLSVDKKANLVTYY